MDELEKQAHGIAWQNFQDKAFELVETLEARTKLPRIILSIIAIVIILFSGGLAMFILVLVGGYFYWREFDKARTTLRETRRVEQNDEFYDNLD